jgi:hypothetical protein
LGSVRVTKNNEQELRELIEKKIELEEEPFIRKAQVEGKKSQDDVARIDGWMNKINAKPVWVLDHAKVRARFGIFLFFFLVLASYALMFLTFEPYEIGIKAHFASLGIILATAMMLDGMLVSFYSKKWVLFSLTGVALICLLVAHIQLGLVRGELFRTLGTSSESFYQTTSRLLTIALPMLALGVELAAGLTLFRVIEWLYSPEVRAHRRREKEMRNMIACDREINVRRNRPKVVGAEFAIRLRQAAKKRLSGEMKWAIALPIIILIIILLSLAAGRAFGAELEKNTVILTDLTKSIGPDECAQNAKAVEACLNAAGPGEKITVLAVTDRSFSKPMILLRGKTGLKPGYFKEKLKEERQSLINEWREKAKQIKPAFLNSDVIGAIAIGQIFLEEGSGQEKRLLIFSDMRHVTKALDLESPQELNPAELLATVEERGMIPSLSNVDVFALGVLTDNRSPSYWAALKAFWKGFFGKAGASLKKYSVTREVN